MKRWAALGIMMAALSGLAWGDPGWGGIAGTGINKRTMGLQVRDPAVVRLANCSIAVWGSADKQNQPVLQSLLPTLETELLGNEKSLAKKPEAEADYTIRLHITSFSVTQSQQQNSVYWTGSLRVGYEVVARGNKVFDAGNVKADGKAQSGGIPIVGSKGPKNVEELKEDLVGKTVHQLVLKFGNSKHTIQVRIAVGDDHLSRAADFMDKQLWSRALDELEKMPAFKKTPSEAFRQYDLGLAHEAMAYEAKSLSDQKENLFQAQEYYDKAVEMNVKDKYFVEAVARAKTALAKYKAFEGMDKKAPKGDAAPKADAPPPALAQEKSQSKTAPKTVAKVNPPPTTPAKTAPPKSQGKTLKMADVIQMYQSGVPQDQIAAIIRSSNVVFDPLDKDTAIAIAQAKLPVTLQNEMRTKVGAPLLGPAASTKK